MVHNSGMDFGLTGKDDLGGEFHPVVTSLTLLLVSQGPRFLA